MVVVFKPATQFLTAMKFRGKQAPLVLHRPFVRSPLDNLNLDLPVAEVEVVVHVLKVVAIVSILNQVFDVFVQFLLNTTVTLALDRGPEKRQAPVPNAIKTRRQSG